MIPHCSFDLLDIKLFFNLLSFIYLFGCARSHLWRTATTLVAAYGVQFPDQGWNPGPLHLEHGVLDTGPPGKS